MVGAWVDEWAAELVVWKAVDWVGYSADMMAMMTVE